MESISLIGDSWLIDDRLQHSEYFKRSLFRASCIHMPPETVKFYDIRNFSRRSLKVTDLTGPLCQEFRMNWATNMPKLTVAHLGACDLTAQEVPELCETTAIKAHYAKFILQHVEDFRLMTRRLSPEVSEFDESYRNHIWLFVTPPIWGDDFRPRTSVDAREYGRRMIRAATSMRNMQRLLWTSEHLAITTPDMQVRTFRGNHLVPKAQSVYLRNLSRVVNGLLCPHCTPSREYDAGQFKDLQYHRP